jgi:hypothetical protein
MGKDGTSSEMRVAPVLDQLRGRDNTGAAWLQTLLSLPTRDGASRDRVITPPIREGSLRYGTTEATLLPPVSLLHYLVDHGAELSWPSHDMSDDTVSKRRALMQGDPDVRAEAHALLDRGVRERGWHVFEARSHPDVYLETDDAIVVLEGKQTERRLTTHTSWLPGRDQMLRHLDAAWELRGDRRVYGLLIVEADAGAEVPAKWRLGCDQMVSSDGLARSLPHRSREEQRAIANAFLGVTTWQRICQALHLKELV